MFQEERFTLHTPEERRAFNPAYFKKEAEAVARLLEFAQQRIAEKKYDEALKFLDGTLMSNLRVRQAQDMKVEFSARWAEIPRRTSWRRKRSPHGRK